MSCVLSDPTADPVFLSQPPFMDAQCVKCEDKAPTKWLKSKHQMNDATGEPHYMCGKCYRAEVTARPSSFRSTVFHDSDPSPPFTAGTAGRRMRRCNLRQSRPARMEEVENQEEGGRARRAGSFVLYLLAEGGQGPQEEGLSPIHPPDLRRRPAAPTTTRHNRTRSPAVAPERTKADPNDAHLANTDL